LSKPRAGVNTNRAQFTRVYSAAARESLRELVDLDESLIPEHGTLEEVQASIRGADVVLSTWGAQPYTRDLLDIAPDLKLILYAAGSFKAQVTSDLVKHAPIVCNAAHLNAVPTAEFSLMLILLALKDAIAGNQRLRKNGPAGWAKDSEGYRGGYYRTTVSVLGLGAVSRHLIRLLRNFDVEILVADDFLAEATAAELGARKVTVEEAMREADAVTIHHADVERNWGIVNAETLALMKDGARLINTSRGRMIVEDDLVAELEKGRISAYLDVTHPEPPPPGHPFYTLPNCFLTPHIAGSLSIEVQRMGDYCVRELQRWINGEEQERVLDITNLENRA
jgi:phosphoglycerate dehydrogenase-like enzyme